MAVGTDAMAAAEQMVGLTRCIALHAKNSPAEQPRAIVVDLRAAEEASGPNRTRARQSDRDPGPGPWSRRCAICLHGQADHDCVQCAQPICRACGDLGCHEYNGKPHVLTPRQIWNRR